MTTIIYVVLKQDVSGDNPISNLLSINKSHIQATESMLCHIEANKKDYDENIVVDRNRIEILDRSPCWIGSSKCLRLVYTIQEFECVNELEKIIFEEN